MTSLSTKKPTRKNEKGVALVMAMMIVALIAIIATEISWRFELSMSRSGNRWAGMQARSYLEGAEQLAIVALREDAKNSETSEVDHLGEIWAQEAQPFPTDHGWVKGEIKDASGRFNVNTMSSVATNCPNGAAKPDTGVCSTAPCDQFTEQQFVFIRLLQTFDLGDEEEPVFLTTAQAEEITEAVVDWLDADSEIRGFGGAESDYYEALDPPITIANQEMISVSELQVIKGMQPKLYQQLMPHIVALPAGDVGLVNVHTATANVLRAIKAQDPQTPGSCDSLPHEEDVVGEMMEFVRNGEFKELKLMKGDGGLPSAWADPNFDNIFGKLMDILQSQYFLFYGEAAIGEDYIRRGSSLIKRDESGGGNSSGGQNPNQGQIKIEVVRRTDANF